MKIHESGCKLFPHELCPAGLSLEDFREEVRTAKAIRPCQGFWSNILMASNAWRDMMISFYEGMILWRGVVTIHYGNLLELIRIWRIRLYQRNSSSLCLSCTGTGECLSWFSSLIPWLFLSNGNVKLSSWLVQSQTFDFFQAAMSNVQGFSGFRCFSLCKKQVLTSERIHQTSSWTA